MEQLDLEAAIAGLPERARAVLVLIRYRRLQPRRDRGVDRHGGRLVESPAASGPPVGSGGPGEMKQRMEEQELLRRIAELPREIQPQNDPWAAISLRIDETREPQRASLALRRLGGYGRCRIRRVGAALRTAAGTAFGRVAIVAARQPGYAGQRTRRAPGVPPASEPRWQRGGIPGRLSRVHCRGPGSAEPVAPNH